MTKAELEKDRDAWKERAESLQDELDALNEAYGELEQTNYDLTWELDTGSTLVIQDYEDFKFRAISDGVWSDELEQFIQNYRKFYQRTSED